MPRNYTPGEGPRFGHELVWRRDIMRYGDLCRALGAAEPGSSAWHSLTLESAKAVLALCQRAAALEMELEKLKEVL